MIFLFMALRKKLEVELMGRTCRGICIFYKAKPVSNKIRYEIGHKRCSFCGIFFEFGDVRCICCKAVLRTKARKKITGKLSSLEFNLKNPL